MYIERFIKSVNTYGNNIAVKYKEESLTYIELDEKSNCLASVLIDQGAQQNIVIATYLERDINLLVSILAIMKTGACYLPLDKENPKEKNEYILENSNANIIISDSTCEFEKKSNRKIIDVYKSESNKRNIDPNIKYLPDDLSYILYTSGSTGDPKGVMIHQKGMLNHIECKIYDLEINSSSVIAQTASQSFDISIWQFLAPLLVGGKVVIYDNQMLLNLKEAIFCIQRDGITILELVPSYISLLMEYANKIYKNSNIFSNIKYFVSTGESLTLSLASEMLRNLPKCNIVNAYGPTEASDDVTHYIFSNIDGLEQIPLGYPIKGMKIYIVDEEGNHCLNGERGEIWVAGIGVGKGYINNQQLTDQLFILNPFSDKQERLYKTGDIGSINENGELLYWGRKDYQVQYNGKRLELEEIEVALGAFKGINQVCVLLESYNTNHKLCAYYSSKHPYNENELRTFLKKKLRKAEIPDMFIWYERFQLTANGKIDRDQLKRSIATVNMNEIRGICLNKYKLYKVFIKNTEIDKNIGYEKIWTGKFIDLGLNSLSFIQFILNVETEFDIEINEDLSLEDNNLLLLYDFLVNNNYII